MDQTAPAPNWWTSASGPSLFQGDLLEKCLVPIVQETMEPGGQPVTADLIQIRLVVITQTCDLANGKADFVSLCPVFTLEEFEAENQSFQQKGKWEEVRKQRIEGLYMLSSPSDPANNRASLVVEFGQIMTVPLSYLSKHAVKCGARWRMQSPYLEHFSQAFARFFMRVGLPSTIPPFESKKK